MSTERASRRAGRVVVAASLVLSMAGAPALLAAPTAAAPAPSPAEVVRETGSWFAHGYTLDLHPDGTGAFAAWVGAFDGTRIGLRLIPAPGAATVAEVTAVETVGAGALDPSEQPGVGGLVTVAFGDAVRTAHVEWSPGPRRFAVDLCPTEGLDAAAMAILRCGA
ncbi:hypothetical protein [Dietzia sp. PP-33]|uniref:hypothetical protein n=1 Tax=Dietzia sp. PP-33 TaxID=2957500 RepID=UPI0029A043A7|nr:hypothetical protein [Dietzia sp. PP-33]MDX2356569.1 hypothetical protein [Dietzia sp. PP-33]